MDILRQDLIYGLRRLRQSPGFTLLAVATLALGIGATSALFSVVEGVLLRPLPYPKPDQIVSLWEVGPDGNRMRFADPNFEDVRSQAASLAGVAGYATSVVTVSGGAEPTRALVASVSADFFAVLGAHPERGRAFAPAEHRFGSAPVALVSHDYWTRVLGGSTALSELKLTTDALSAPVIGVLPAGFRFPDDADIWVPRESVRPRLPSRTAHNWRVVGRLRDGIGLLAARAELTTIAGRLRRQYGPDTMMTDVAVVPLREAITGGVRSALAILFGAAASLLLIAAANVVNMLLAQTATRTRELAIRAALGAGRGRLVRQSLTEALLLSLGAGVVGVLFAAWGVDALRRAAPATLPRVNEVAVNGRVLLFAMAVSIAVAAALGALIAWRATASDPQAALGEGSRGEVGTVRAHRLGRLMVAGQLAGTLVLLVGAGLLGRSLLRVLAVDPGFDRTRVVTVELALPDVEEEQAAGRRAHTSPTGEALRRSGFTRGAPCRRGQRVLGADEVAGPGRAGPQGGVRQHGRRSAPPGRGRGRGGRSAGQPRRPAPADHLRRLSPAPARDLALHHRDAHGDGRGCIFQRNAASPP
jgi:predicted permease